MVWFIRANIKIKGIYGLYDGLMNLSQLVKDNDAVIYPQSEDPPLNSGHAAALGWLATTQCIAEIKAIHLTEEHSCTLQDIINTGSISNGQDRYSSILSTWLIKVNTYFQKNGLPDLREQLSGIDKSLAEISSYANQYSESYQLNCDLLHVFLNNNIYQLSQLNEPTHYNSESSDRNEGMGINPKITVFNSSDKKISSRQEVIMMLDHILEYFQSYELSHPAHMFIHRTKEMIGMDFYSIVEEILPEAVIALKQLAGKNNPPFR